MGKGTDAALPEPETKQEDLQLTGSRCGIHVRTGEKKSEVHLLYATGHRKSEDGDGLGIHAS